MDELVTVRECLFRTVPDRDHRRMGKTSPWRHGPCMVTLLKVGEDQLRVSRPLPLGLHVLHMYMHLKNGSGKVFLVVRNTSNSHIFLKKGVPVARVMLPSLVPPRAVTGDGSCLGCRNQTRTHVSGGDTGEAAGKIEPGWAGPLVPNNAAAARELVLAYHDVLALESNELGCTSAIEHEICIENGEPFKEQFWHYLHPCWRRCTHHSRICWRQGQFI